MFKLFLDSFKLSLNGMLTMSCFDNWLLFKNTMIWLKRMLNKSVTSKIYRFSSINFLNWNKLFRSTNWMFLSQIKHSNAPEFIFNTKNFFGWHLVFPMEMLFYLRTISPKMLIRTFKFYFNSCISLSAALLSKKVITASKISLKDPLMISVVNNVQNSLFKSHKTWLFPKIHA